jgi:hypothetical protein
MEVGRRKKEEGRRKKEEAKFCDLNSPPKLVKFNNRKIFY